MRHRLAHSVGRSSQATPAAVDKPQSASHTEFLTLPRKPAAGLLMHTDRGSQYASASHRKLIKDYEMVQSMSRRANCWDNSVMESFFKTLKVELVHQQRYETRAQARTDIVSWIEGFYNRQRIHSSIGYESPIDAECGLMAA